MRLNSSALNTVTLNGAGERDIVFNSQASQGQGTVAAFSRIVFCSSVSAQDQGSAAVAALARSLVAASAQSQGVLGTTLRTTSSVIISTQGQGAIGSLSRMVTCVYAALQGQSAEAGELGRTVFGAVTTLQGQSATGDSSRVLTGHLVASQGQDSAAGTVRLITCESSQEQAQGAQLYGTMLSKLPARDGVIVPVQDSTADQLVAYTSTDVSTEVTTANLEAGLVLVAVPVSMVVADVLEQIAPAKQLASEFITAVAASTSVVRVPAQLMTGDVQVIVTSVVVPREELADVLADQETVATPNSNNPVIVPEQTVEVLL